MVYYSAAENTNIINTFFRKECNQRRRPDACVEVGVCTISHTALENRDALAAKMISPTT